MAPVQRPVLFPLLGLCSMSCISKAAVHATLQGLRSLMSTLMISLPAFYNVGALIALLWFIYSYVGVLLFGNVKRGTALNHHANFEHFCKLCSSMPVLGSMCGPGSCGVQQIFMTPASQSALHSKV